MKMKQILLWLISPLIIYPYWTTPNYAFYDFLKSCKEKDIRSWYKVQIPVHYYNFLDNLDIFLTENDKKFILKTMEETVQSEVKVLNSVTDFCGMGLLEVKFDNEKTYILCYKDVNGWHLNFEDEGETVINFYVWMKANKILYEAYKYYETKGYWPNSIDKIIYMECEKIDMVKSFENNKIEYIETGINNEKFWVKCSKIRDFPHYQEIKIDAKEPYTVIVTLFSKNPNLEEDKRYLKEQGFEVEYVTLYDSGGAPYKIFIANKELPQRSALKVWKELKRNNFVVMFAPSEMIIK